MSVPARAFTPAVLLLAVAGLTSCGGVPVSSPPAPANTVERPQEPAPEPGADRVHWAYDGDDGPTHWGELSDDFALCADGSHQSPVDLPARVPHGGGRTDVQVGDAEGAVADTGHTFQLTVNDGAGTSVIHDQVTYDLVQMHYHVPSEHTVAGDPADVEFHFVHRSPDGGVLVLGLLAEKGDKTPAVQPFIDAVRADEQTETDLDLSRMLPGESPAYSYEGSLTTPPCTEGVQWLVLQERITLSSGQLAVLTRAEDHNARSTHPLGDREVDGTDLRFGD